MAGRRAGRRGLHRRGLRRPGRRREAVHGGRGRPRHQGEHAADDGRARHRGARAARDRLARGRAGGRSPTGCSSPTVPATRRRRPRQVELLQGALGAGPAVLRDLLRQPALRPGARVRHLQAQVRPPRHQPAGDGPDDRQGRGHRAQPRVRGRRTRSTRPTETPYGRSRSATSASTTTWSRGSSCATPDGRAAELLGAVPPGGGGRSARCGVPVRPVRRPDGGRMASGPPDRRALRTDARRTPDAEADRHRERAGDRQRADHHRAGVRVRLLRHPGLPGAQGRGAAGRSWSTPTRRRS